MRRLVHLSDLHFGRDRPEVVGPLTQSVNALMPDLVIVSGDFTQRATDEQFAAAATFIKTLKAPTLCVPGNHDVPLHNLFMRIFMPFHRYRRWINADLNPIFQDEQILVIGVNTVNPFAWQRGWFRSRAIERVCAAFGNSTDPRKRIVVAHHPLEHLPAEAKSLMHGATTALRRLSESGFDAVLSGHLHSWHAGPFAHVDGRYSALQVYAGTSLSNRLRGEVNDFNVLEICTDSLKVSRHAFSDRSASFVITNVAAFIATSEGWKNGKSVRDSGPELAK
jgi:3',5'-cyclic AMP phosphodiesterase CpdA